MKRTKLSALLVVILLAAVFMFGCANDSKNGVQGDGTTNVENINNIDNSKYPMEIEDGFGNIITINEKPEKVISISPSQTEVLFALGLEDKVVAVSDYCDYPAAALEKEKVGSALAINIEKVLELDPDILFLYSEVSPEAIEQLRANEIIVMMHSPETTEEIFNNILQVGKLMDVEEKAEQIVGEMKDKKESIVKKVKDADKVRVFYQVWDEPLMTAGEGSFIHELITLAGGENVAADGDGAYPQYSVEAMIEKDPEVYIAPAHTLEDFTLDTEEMNALKNTIKSRPGYDVISAVKNDRIELLEPNIVSRPGVRTIEALELIAKAIHPELF